jgi:hypothetical protein
LQKECKFLASLVEFVLPDLLGQAPNIDFFAHDSTDRANQLLFCQMSEINTCKPTKKLIENAQFV